MKQATTQEQVIKRLLALCVLLVAMVVGSLVSIIVINNLQSSKRDKKIQDILDQQTRDLISSNASTDTIKNRMACLGTFLSRENRADLSITNFDTCTFQDRKTGQSGTLPVNEVFSPTAQQTPGGQATPAPQRQEQQAQPQTQTQSQPTQPTEDRGLVGCVLDQLPFGNPPCKL